jgi:hypothetical protein
MSEDYSSSDLFWGIALHAAIGAILGVGLFVQGIFDEIAFIISFSSIKAIAPVLAVIAALPVGIINGKRLSNSKSAMNCSALSCGIGFLVMWGVVVMLMLLGVQIFTDLQSSESLALLYQLFLAPVGAAMGAAAAWISSTMAFGPMKSSAVNVQQNTVQTQTAGNLAPSYVAAANTVQGGRDLYDWEVAEKKHEERLGRIPRF